jgi:hypothetical protein
MDQLTCKLMYCKRQEAYPSQATWTWLYHACSLEKVRSISGASWRKRTCLIGLGKKLNAPNGFQDCPVVVQLLLTSDEIGIAVKTLW